MYGAGITGGGGVKEGARTSRAMRTALRRRSISEISCAAADVEAPLPARTAFPAVTALALNAAPPPLPAGAGPSGECSTTGYGDGAPGELDDASEAGELRFALSDPYEGERLRRRCASSPPALCVAPTASRPASRDDGSWALGERAYGDRRGGSTGMRGGGVPERGWCAPGRAPPDTPFERRERFEAAEVADRAECADLAEPAERYPASPRRELTPDAVE